MHFDNIIVIMRKILYSLFIITLLFAFSPTAWSQASLVMSNGYYLTVDGRVFPYGTIVDDGDSTGMYSNGFYGMAIITARAGDTIVLTGSSVLGAARVYTLSVLPPMTASKTQSANSGLRMVEKPPSTFIDMTSA